MSVDDMDQFRFIPPRILQTIREFDWNERPESASASFWKGAVLETAVALERLSNSSDALRQIVARYQIQGALETELPQEPGMPLFYQIMLVSAARPEIQEKCYWAILGALLFELEVGVTDLMTEHTWTLERLIPECQAYNEARRFDLTIERCEAHLKVSRSEYGFNNSVRLRERYSDLGRAIVLNALGFFSTFSDAFRRQRNYEYAIAVADFLLKTDLAIEADNEKQSYEIVLSRMDELLSPPFLSADGKVDHDWMYRQLSFALEVVESFDRSIGQLISEAAISDVGSLRRRRELVRRATLGIELGQDFRWERIEFLANHAPIEAISELFSRYFRNLDESDIESQIIQRLSSEIDGWRLLQPRTDWWSLPYAAARTLLVAELVVWTLFQIGHRRSIELAKQLLLAGKDDYWELGTCLMNAPNVRLKRLANRAMNSLSKALINEPERDAVIDRLQNYLEIGPGESRNALSPDIAEVIRERCGLDHAPDDWDRDVFELHVRLGFVLIEVNRVFEGTALFKAIFGYVESTKRIDDRVLERIVRYDPKCLPAFFGGMVKLAFVENESEALSLFLSAMLCVDDSVWKNPTELLSAIQDCIRVRSLPTFVAHQLVVTVATCANLDSSEDLRGCDVIKQYLELDKLAEGKMPRVVQQQEPQAWMPMLSDCISQMVSRGENEDALKLIAGIAGRKTTDRIETLDVLNMFSDTGFGKVFRDILGPDLVQSTIRCLNGLGRTDEAMTISKAVAADWFKSDSEGISTEAKCSLALVCIRTLITNDPESVRDLMWEASWFLSSDHEAYGLTSVDRIRLIALTAECRHTLSEVANTLLFREETGRHAFSSLFPNEMSLSVQQLVERIRRGIYSQDLADGPSMAEGWAMSRKARRRIRQERSKEPTTVSLSQSAIIPERSITSSSPQPDPGNRQEWFSKARFRSKVTESIGIGRQLLKVGFSMEGQLVWSLLDAESEWVNIKAFGRGSEGARDAITAAIERFQRKLDAAWDVRGIASESKVSQKLDDLRWQLNMEAGEVVSPEVFQADAPNRLTILKASFPRTYNQFVQQFGQPAGWGTGKSKVPDRIEWNNWWSETIECLRTCPYESHAFSQHLDQVTEDLLTEISNLWPLEELFAALDPDCELLIQPSGVLHSVPMTFLSVRDAEGKRRFLFEKVNTVAVVVSPLIDWWQRENLDVVPQAGSQNSHRIASVSWLGTEELKREADLYATYLLQASHAHLRKTYGETYSWWSAGGSRKTPGSHGVLARGIRDAGEVGLALLTICGHGAANTTGIVLQDGLWQGREFLEEPEEDGQPFKRTGGVDLASSQFVILLSCSMGRLKQSRLRDVEGFCVDLIVNNARSVLAGRWTLHAVDSIRFAHSVAKGYLRRHRKAMANGEPLWKSRPRGKAVAAARRHWAEELRNGRATIGINTVAALELYGLR